MPFSPRNFHRLAWFAVLLALVIVVFGAFVRLSNAGLSCPDWPTCYGRATWPVQAHEIATANASFERAVETHKAWREQVHRHLAAGLGVVILILTLVAVRRRKLGPGIPEPDGDHHCGRNHDGDTAILRQFFPYQVLFPTRKFFPDP